MEFLAAHDKAAPSAPFLKEESSRSIGFRRCVKSLPEEISESSSSVVVSGESSENEEEEDGVVSSQGTWFGSSLEDCLPIKRGLSNHYIGKSKSFGNLMEASKVKDLEKVESPLNKRRRLIIAKKLRRSSLSSFSIYSKTNNDRSSMPLLALQESEEEDHNYNYDNDNDKDDSSDAEISKLQEKRMKMTTNSRDIMVQTHSCLCLTSFQDDDR